ncbi:hypothetical protein MMC11_003859 [Xylographa trunciseda]|nr:hypothetical protein [Xylographa trunciseda]
MLYTSSLFRWLQRKRYQYEVTFSLYMLTPTEKFIFSKLDEFLSILLVARLLAVPSLLLSSPLLAAPFSNDSFLVLFLSMIIIAASLYLPEHISTIMRRAWFYWAGDETIATGTKSVLGSTAVARSIAENVRYGGVSGPEDVLERLGSL